MKKIIAVLLVVLLLCGCGASTPVETVPAQPSTAATEPTTVATEAPTTVATEPPFDPMDIVQTMTLEEKVGQMILVRCPAGGRIEAVENYHLGGYVLFGRDTERQSVESLSSTIANYQSASKIPMLIAVDEEGGTVCRISNQPAFRDSRFPSPRKLYEEGGVEAVLEAEREKSQLLASLGINVNLAPVCDITTNPNAFMYDRSLGLSPEETGSIIAQMVQVMEQEGVQAVLKHFPGYGNNDDTHVGIASDIRPKEELAENDLVPFDYGFRAGAGAVMVSHVFIEDMDYEYPASLSPVVHAFIRDTMGFDGVIMTDDMAMDGIRKKYGAELAVVLAVMAGNDIICCSDYELTYRAILDGVNNGKFEEAMIDRAVCRVIQWKYDMGLIQ